MTFERRRLPQLSHALLLLVAGMVLTVSCAVAQEAGSADTSIDSGEINVLSYLPDNYVRDGSVSYQADIQRALNEADSDSAVVRFPPMVYLLDDPSGLDVSSNTIVSMRGARFVLAKGMEADGQAFVVRDAENVQFIGGIIVGQRDAWDGGVNIAGIRVFGVSKGIRIQGTRFENLSSNGVGVFGKDAVNPIRDVQVVDVTVVNCCNYYGDYLQKNAGTAKGSQREDQGSVAFYHVDDWVVSRCRFEGSQSDGTHFYKSNNGRFVNNRVLNSNMGGYFLEECEKVLASGNLISRNGSRGVTIERNSLFCTLTNNIIEFSGREGLWAPDIEACLVSDNVFRENGRKDDKERDSEIRIDEGDHYVTKTSGIRVVNNMFYTTEHQNSVVRIGAGVRDTVVRGNAFRGPVTNVHTEVEDLVAAGIIIEDNRD